MLAPLMANDDVITKFRTMNARTSPGPGATAKANPNEPDTIHMKSVPNVSTERLHRSVEFYHGSVHTAEGLHEFDGPRRQLAETGMKLRTITHELRLRGEAPGTCKHCWGE